MRFPIIPASLALCACQPVPPLDAIRENPREMPVPPSAYPPRTEAAPAPLPSVPAKAPVLARKTIRGISFEGVSFDSRDHRLEVIDQPLGPGSTFLTARDAAAAHDALAALNAGFFTPEGKPLGLVVTAGKRSGAWNSASSLGSGIFAESATGHLSLSRRSAASAVADARELLQAGPLLVENGRTVAGLDREKPAVRSLLITDGGYRWWIGKTSLCTLAALGDALASSSPTAWPARTALNLDGGRSTDLFVSSKIPGGPIHRRGMLNRPVRNFLILRPR
jgi:hypothetical protein